MSAALTVPKQASEKAVHELLSSGNFDKLDGPARAAFLLALCDSLGLNPATQPFEFVRLSGKLTLYAKKDCAEQMRKIHGVSVEKVEQSSEDGLHSTTVWVRDSSGRTDCDVGIVSIKGLSGESLANARMKSLTKAKRRATLSICGLGCLLEDEFDTIRDKISPVELELQPVTVSYKKEKLAAVGREDAIVDTPSVDQALELIQAADSAKRLAEIAQQISASIKDPEKLRQCRTAFNKRLAELGGK